MAQHDYNLANQSGADFRADLNNALSAIVTVNSGATAPSTTFAHQLWVDTSSSVLKIRNSANDAWVTTGVSITADNTFTGNLTGNVTGNVTGDITGNADTATALETARTINGTSFDGTANISFDTDSVSEGSSNLYYTSARFDSAFGGKSTTNLSEGSNLYYTDARSRAAISATGDISYNSTTGVISFTETTAPVTSVFGRTGVVVATSGDYTTAQVTESGNLYYTDARVQAVSINNVVEDTTPQLGGNLDLNSNNITGTGNIDVTGTVTSDGLTVDGIASIDAGGNNTHTIGRLIIDYAGSGNPKLMSEGGDQISIDADLNIVGGEVIKATSQPSHFNFKQARTGYDIAFYTAPTANNTFVKALEIDGSGDISFYDDTGSTQGLFWDASAETLAIGHTNPSSTYRLDVAGSIRSTGTAPSYTLQESDASNQTWLMGSYGGTFAVRDTTVSGTAYPLQIQAGTPSNTLYLKSDGKTGIGTDSPQDKLSIQGGDVSINNGSAFQVGGCISGNTIVGRLKNESGVLTLKGDSTRDVQFGSETNGTAMFIEGSNGNIGIGTDLPSAKLQVFTDTGRDFKVDQSVANRTILSNSYRMVVKAGSGYDLDLDTGSANGKITFQNNGSEVARFDNAGRLGIGTTSPTNSITTTGALEFTGNAFNGSGTGVWSPATNELGFVTSGSTQVRINSSGNVGIGTDLPTNGNLQIGDSDADFNIAVAGARSKFGYDSSNNSAVVQGGITKGIIFCVNNSTFGSGEAGRFDTSGNFLVGKTSANIGTVGHQLLSDSGGDYAAHTSNGTRALLLNRLTSDGSLIDFYKDGSTVGSIGTVGADVTIGTGDTGLRFRDEFDAIQPHNITTNGTVDGVISLGKTGATFKDLHISGTAYINGTAPSILLTDSDTGADSRISASSGAGSLFIDADLNNEAAFSTMSFRIDGSEAGRFDTSGNLLVGKTSADTVTVAGHELHEDGLTIFTTLSGKVLILNRQSDQGTIQQFRQANGTVGSISVTSSATTYNTSSDARLKDVTGEARGLEVITKLNPVAYNWKADGKADEGLIAQEVKELVPNAVTGSEDEHYQMDYSKLVTHLVKGMKEQQEQIEFLKEEIANLKGE